MYGQDGISGIRQMNTAGVNHLPAKVFVGGIKILKIECKIEGITRMLYRNSKANSPFQPAFFNCICDKSADASLQLVFRKTEPSVTRLKSHIMLVGGLFFDFEVSEIFCCSKTCFHCLGVLPM